MNAAVLRASNSSVGSRPTPNGVRGLPYMSQFSASHGRSGRPRAARVRPGARANPRWARTQQTAGGPQVYFIAVAQPSSALPHAPDPARTRNAPATRQAAAATSFLAEATWARSWL